MEPRPPGIGGQSVTGLTTSYGRGTTMAEYRTWTAREEVISCHIDKTMRERVRETERESKTESKRVRE